MSYRGLLAADAPARRAAQNSMLEVEFGQLSDRGRIREQNEDYLGYVLPATPAEARTHGWLFALADGGRERARRLSRRCRRRTALDVVAAAGAGG